MTCRNLDAQVAHPQDAELIQLLRQFVPVRFVSFKGIDMNRFRFDYDLTFAVLMMDAGGRTYSRFGSQDWTASTDRMSITGLKKAMRDVLAVHRSRKPETSPPVAAQVFTVDSYPAFRKTKRAGERCYHCHYAHDAELAQLREDGKFTKEKLFRYPVPETVGLSLEVDRNNVVASVLPGTPAEKAGVKAGDVILEAGQTPVFTSADLQFALDPIADPGALRLQLERSGKRLPPATLQLPKGWRRYDISWRPSQGDIPPTVGVWAEPLKPSQKQQRGVPEDKLALRVSFLFPGPAWAKTRGELKLNDVIVGVNGKALPAMTTRQFHTWFRLSFDVGETATLEVLRGDQRLSLPVPCIEAKDG